MIIRDILKTIEYISFIGVDNYPVSKPYSLNDKHIDEYALYWCKDNLWEHIKDIHIGTVIVGRNTPKEYFSKYTNYIIVENPRGTFTEIINRYFKPAAIFSVSNKSSISKESDIGHNVFIGDNVVVESGCVIGNNVRISHNAVILENTIIGDNVTIGANTTIGGVGFGYEKINGKYELIQHIGNVVIKDNVNIGNNTAIDRAVLGSTIIEEGCKIDNLVHIAHGVHIKKNSMVIANAMIAGSVVIGENSWVAPSASVLNKINIGDDAVIGMGAVVIRNVNDKEVVAGNPSKLIKIKE